MKDRSQMKPFDDTKKKDGDKMRNGYLEVQAVFFIIVICTAVYIVWSFLTTTSIQG